MSNKAWKRNLEKIVKDYLSGYNTCHDYFHHLRTLKNALKIAKHIKCDSDVIYAAALLHDVGYKDNENDSKKHPIFGMKLAEKWLKSIDFPKTKIHNVLEAIRLHDNFSWGHDHEPTEINEIKIIQDADRIEAIGAIGVARFSHWFGEKGFPIYDPTPVPKSNVVWLDHSLLDQLRRDGTKKWKYMNYEVSKKMSKKQAEFMNIYYKMLKKELTDGK